MSLAHIKTVGRLGIRCFPITVEVDVCPGLPAFHIVGLPDTIVQESKERIRAAVKNSGATFPLSRITVNLAPASIPKEGIGFDLPIAVGILTASEQVPHPSDRTYFFGELGLQGELKQTRGTLAVTLYAREAQAIYIPSANHLEGRLTESRNNVFSLHSLQDLIYVLKGEKTIKALIPIPHPTFEDGQYPYDFSDIKGQYAAKRALEIAASGHHNILLSGSPGAGKTLLSRSLPSIMPPLSRTELIETTQIYSVAGLLSEGKPLVTERPFRAPHHSSSLIAMVGGSTPPRPGEITLAHNGVLFLDEFAEFPRSVIESLRQPLEDRTITVARAGYSAEFPAHCLLVAAINPCPCGYKDDPKQQCICTPQQILLYRKKLSGPILDRIDMHIVVPPVKVNELAQTKTTESSVAIRQRVVRARLKQSRRYKSLGIGTNSQLTSKHINSFCPLDVEAARILEQAVMKLNLTARSYHKVLKLARTITDLDDTSSNREDNLISARAVAEALQYRPVVH